MNSPWPRLTFREFLRQNLRSYTLGSDEDANLVGMRWYGGGPFHRELKPALRIAKKSHFVIRVGDVIYNKLFAWKGAFGIVPKELDGMFVSDKFPTYELDRNLCDENFLRWYFRCPPLWEEARALSTGSAAVSKLTLNPPKFLDLTISLPPLAEQRRIVARIEKLAAKIEEARGLRHRAAEEADALGRARGRVQFQVALDQYGARSLGNLTTRITKGESPEWQGFAYQESGPLFIRSENVLWGRLDTSNATHISDMFHQKLSRSQVEAGDVLVNLVGASIGRACIVPAGLGDANVNQAVAVMSTRREFLVPDFLVLFLLSPSAQEDIHGGKVETARPNISLGDLRDLMTPVPPLPEQRRIVAELDALQSKVDSLKHTQAEAAAELDALLPSVLDRAFAGAL